FSRSGDTGADRRNDARVPGHRVPHVPGRAAGAVRRRNHGDADPRSQADGRCRTGGDSLNPPTTNSPSAPLLRAGSHVRYDAGVSTGRVFRRMTALDPPVAVEAHGTTIVDADGREYLDAAGGAIVVNVGHGRAEIAAVMAAQAA